MQDSGARSVAAVEAELRAGVGARRVAQRELAEVRRRQVELAHLESNLVEVVATRRLDTDRLLDERLSASGGGGA